MGKKNKFSAVKTVYDGCVFHSKKEANYARTLDMLKKSVNKDERVLAYKKQVPFPIMVDLVKICNYILDFQITYVSGKVEYVDIKGYTKGDAYSLFRIKKKLVETIYKIEIIER